MRRRRNAYVLCEIALPAVSFFLDRGQFDIIQCSHRL